MYSKIIRKSIGLAIVGAMSLTLSSCGDDFVETEPLGDFTGSNYYKDRDQAYTALVATYDAMKKYGGSFENTITFLNAGSDDCLAGGGSSSDGAGIQNFCTYTLDQVSMPRSYWNNFYQGVFRANVLIKVLPDVPMDNPAEKARFLAEAKALRALYYFELLRMFKNIPLITEPFKTTDDYRNIPQANPEDVWKLIEDDLLASLNDLPVTIASSETGRLSKGAAKAILGKVYLYQGKNTLAAAQFADINGATPGTATASSYGYKLLSNYADLWKVDNKFNTESVLEAAHSKLSNTDWTTWQTSKDEGNTINTMVGPRSYVQENVAAPEIPSGWSFNTVTPSLYAVLTGDPRFESTIFDAKALEAAGSISYQHANQDTGYFLNKFLPRAADETNGTGEKILNYRQNVYVIRLADTYLMEAEALGGTGTRAQALLDAVRARVGLPSVPVSMAAIKLERRKELAGEGHRFFDLVRWGDAPSVLGSRGFVAGKNEIFPIPYQELDNTILKQNPNY